VDVVDGFVGLEGGLAVSPEAKRMCEAIEAHRKKDGFRSPKFDLRMLDAYVNTCRFNLGMTYADVRAHFKKIMERPITDMAFESVMSELDELEGNDV
jgi:hypothetical protein